MKIKSWDALPLGCFSSSPNLPALAGSGSSSVKLPVALDDIAEFISYENQDQEG